MGLEPSFSRNTPAWPLAGAGMLPLEPSDPTLVIPRGALQVSPGDMIEQGSIVGIDPELMPPQDESRTDASARPAVDARKWPIAVVASCVLHAAVAMVLLSVPLAWRTPEDPTQVEGADQAGMMLAGNANEDQAMAGEVTKVTLVPMVQPKPIETVEAQSVNTEESVQPVEQTAAEAPVAETLEPVTETAPPPVATEQVQPEKSGRATPAPEILAVAPQQPDISENVVQQAAQAEAVEPVQDMEAAVPPATETEPPEAITTPQVVEVVPQPRPVEQKAPKAEPKPVRQAKEDTKEAPAKPVRRRTSVGSGGANQADAKRGVATGSTKGDTAIASKGGAKSSAGNATAPNYPGKVAAKLRRVARGLSRAAQASARSNAQVSFVIGAGGDVRSVRLVRSSGSPGLDEAALSIIQRAAPFPPIPAQAERTSWAFTLPIGPF